jgi:hypothetical protein
VLFYVDLNDVDKVCDTFDTHLWHVLSDQKKHQLAAKTPLTDQFRQNDKHDPQDQLSALLTLWFLEMRCAMLGENSIERRQWLDDRWSGVLEYVSFPTAHNDRLFDLCVLQGLHQTQAVDQAVEHEQGLQVVGGEDAKVINPLAEAIRLLHIPSPNSPPGKEAVELLTGVLGQLTAPPSCIGGSDEQRSVIWELFLYALFVAGEQVELKARVTVLEDARPNIPARVQLLQQLNTTTSS